MVDLAVRAIFKRFQKVELEEPKKPTVSRNIDVDDFLKKHQINSPLVTKINEIKGNQINWKKEDPVHVWGSRIRVIKTAIEELLLLVPKNLEAVTQLQGIKEALKTQSVFEQNEKFLAIVDDLSKTALIGFTNELSQLHVPTINTVQEYFKSLGFNSELEFLKYVGFKFEALSKTGIESLQDIDCLELRAWDEDLVMFECFQIALKYEVLNTSDAYQKFLTTLKDKLQNALHTDQLVGEFEKLAKNFIESPGASFRDLVILRQKELLKEYLQQHRCFEVWKDIRSSAPNMTLVGYRSLHSDKITSSSTLYKIGIFHFETLKQGIN